MAIYYRNSQIRPEIGDTIHIPYKFLYPEDTNLRNPIHVTGGVTNIFDDGRIQFAFTQIGKVEKRKEAIFPAQRLDFIWRIGAYVEPKVRNFLYQQKPKMLRHTNATLG